MPNTGKGFSYPNYSDTPDVPRDLQDLANDIDAYLTANPGPSGPSGPSGPPTSHPSHRAGGRAGSAAPRPHAAARHAAAAPRADGHTGPEKSR